MNDAEFDALPPCDEPVIPANHPTLVFESRPCLNCGWTIDAHLEAPMTQQMLDEINDAITRLVNRLAPTADAAAVVDDLTHVVASYIASLHRDTEVDRLLDILDARGGRDVDLAERIDDLRLGRTLHLMVPMRLTDEDDPPEQDGVCRALLDNLGDDWWTADEGDTRFHFPSGATTTVRIV